MLKSAKKIIVILTITALLIPFAGTVFAKDLSDPSAGAMIADTLLARPFGLVSMAVGGAAFIISLPFSAIGGNFAIAYRKLVVEPAKFTCKRPLGDF